MPMMRRFVSGQSYLALRDRVFGQRDARLSFRTSADRIPLTGGLDRRRDSGCSQKTVDKLLVTRFIRAGVERCKASLTKLPKNRTTKALRN